MAYSVGVSKGISTNVDELDCFVVFTSFTCSISFSNKFLPIWDHHLSKLYFDTKLSFQLVYFDLSTLNSLGFSKQNFK